MNRSQQLRDDRLVFYQSQMDRIGEVLREFLRLSGARCAILVDKEGHLVEKVGDAPGFDADTISALVAGAFAATRQIAKLLGEEEFSAMFHQGQRDNIQLNLVGDRTILTVLFDDTTTVGMVRLYANEAASRLVEIFSDDQGAGEEAPNADLEEDFEDRTRERLDSMFK